MVKPDSTNDLKDRIKPAGPPVSSGVHLRLVVFVVIAAIAALSYLGFRNINDASNALFWVSHTNEVIEELQGTLSAEEHAQTSARGYLLLKDESLLSAALQRLSEADRHAQRVAELTHDNPQQQARIPQLKRLMAEQAALIKQSTAAGSANHHLLERSAAQMALLREHIVSMQESERALLLQRMKEAQRTTGVVLATTLGTSALALIFVVASTLLLANQNTLLGHLNAELERASKAKDVFLSSMSHELRTPLNSIIGFNGIMLMELPGPLNPTQRKQAEYIQKAATHLLSLINDMLDLAKVESGKLQLDLHPVHVAPILKDVVASLQPQASQKRLYLYAEPFAGPDEVQGDERSVRQILTNLVSNAVKFTVAGGITVRMFWQENTLHVEVVDTGIGISKSDQPKLFKGFVQLTSADKKQEGTGLGLLLSQRLAQLMNGEVVFRSESGCGSIFTLKLPGGLSADGSHTDN